MPDMEYVDSSNIEQIGYDSDAMELHVLFIGSPDLYVYLEVPLQVFEEFRSADSKGSFLNREIKNVYRFEKR